MFIYKELAKLIACLADGKPLVCQIYSIILMQGIVRDGCSSDLVIRISLMQMLNYVIINKEIK